jgi:excisionase family DNA binding protein
LYDLSLKLPSRKSRSIPFVSQETDRKLRLFFLVKIMGKKLTAAELAERLQMNIQTIYKFARAGRIPCQRIGLRPIRFDEDEIEKFLKDSDKKRKVVAK